MKFRKARKNDIAQMFEILKVNNPGYPEKLALRELNEMFSDSFVCPTYIVAEDKKKILGFGGFIPSWVDNMVFDIFWVNVDPEHKGKGIGSELMKDLIVRIGKMKKPEAKMILISTKKAGFYERFGFRAMGPGYDGDYALMGLRLGSQKGNA